jgi:hypothetical protein
VSNYARDLVYFEGVLFSVLLITMKINNLQSIDFSLKEHIGEFKLFKNKMKISYEYRRIYNFNIIDRFEY